MYEKRESSQSNHFSANVVVKLSKSFKRCMQQQMIIVALKVEGVIGVRNPPPFILNPWLHLFPSHNQFYWMPSIC